MSTKLSKRLSSKRKKPPKNKAEVLIQLGLKAFYPSQLEPASILDLSTWTLDNRTPREPDDLPKSFLHRLWLLRPDARSTCCAALSDTLASPSEKVDGFRSTTINPLDLVTTVFLCANTFLQQEITAHMLQCQFAVPLILPHVDDEEPSSFLLWPLRGVVRQWRPDTEKVQEAVLASTPMPIISCVRLGSCRVSKSEVLNHVMGSGTFLHEGMEGGRLPRSLSNGLVEAAWYLPTGNSHTDIFPVPVVFSNLRGDASTHENCLYFLSQASSAVIVFCDNPEEKTKQLLASCNVMASKLILIDLAETENWKDRSVKFVSDSLQETTALPDASIISGKALNAENLANVLCDTVKRLLPDLRLVTLEEAAKLAVTVGLHCDEGTVCKKNMGRAEDVLKGLHEGPEVFRQKQLPLQGALWSRLAEIEKDESRKNKERKELDPRLQNEKKDIMGRLSRYKKTSSMKHFTNALSTPDKAERMYFLNWMRVKLRLLQMQKQINLKDLLSQKTMEKNGIPEHPDLPSVANDDVDDSDSFYTDSTFQGGDVETVPDTNQEVADSGKEVGSKLIFQTQNNVRSENDYEDKTSSAKEQTWQEMLVKDEEIASVHSCLRRLTQRRAKNLEVNDFESDLALEPSENKGTESLQNEFPISKDKPGSLLLETGTLDVQGTQFSASTIQESSRDEQSYQDAFVGDQTSARSFLLRFKKRHNLQVTDSEREEGFQTQKQQPGEKATLENDAEEQIVQNPFVEDKAITFAKPFLLELEQFTDEDLEVVDSESEIAFEHSFQIPANDKSESLPNGHCDSSNEEILSEGEKSSAFRDAESLDGSEATSQETFSAKGPQAASTEGQVEFSLGLEHFLREMGLIFELAHISPGSGSHNELRLPNLAADLLLSGIPLELMDGDASNIPKHWLGNVLAEIKHRFPRERLKVLTSLGVHQARNAEILSALFGVTFPDGCKSSAKGLYMVSLQVPPKFKKKLNCDFLLLMDVEGLCSSTDGQLSTWVRDNEMATVAAGMSDVLIQNLCSRSASELETNLTLAVNALLRIRECGSVPICKALVQDDGINTSLEATQLQRVSNILKTGERTLGDADNMIDHSKKSIPYVRPWYNEPISKSVDSEHSEVMLKLKRTMFAALKEAVPPSKICAWQDLLARLCFVWDAVKSESFSVSLQNKDIGMALSIFCAEIFQWEESLWEHMEGWLTQATKTIHSTEPDATDPSSQNDFLCELQYEARREVKREVNKHKSHLKGALKENKLDDDVTILKSILFSKMMELEERVTTTTIERLERINEEHFSSTQHNRMETVLELEQNARVQKLLDSSGSENHFVKDETLEEEFEDAWKESLSKFDFRPSETDDITQRVSRLLTANICSQGLQKHSYKLMDFGQNQATFFRVHDEYFGYSSRMKNLFENNKSPKVKAQQLACNVMEHYKQFVDEKVSLPQDFSDSYITELLEMIDKTLQEAQLEIKTAFGVDLKVFVCNAACRDFQKVHNRFAKDGELLKSIKGKKSVLTADFIYQFRKRDQRQKLARRFISDIIQPIVMDYVYEPLGMQIAEEIQSKAPKHLSPQAFHKSLLEEIIMKDQFESFTEYLFSYDTFRLRKIQETVVTHLSDWNVNTWRLQRLGEIVGNVASAVSQVTVGDSQVLSDTKPILKQVCLVLEDSGDTCIPWESLEGPLYSITTEWDHFVTYFMELLAELRLNLAQAFSQHMSGDQLLDRLPTQPRDCLFNKLKGCHARCPACSAPCEVEQTGHELHETLLHRPKCMSEPTSLISPESTNLDNLEAQDITVACWQLQDLHPDWNLSTKEASSSPYWRYALARFSERLAKKYNQKPPVIPEEWKAITKKEALDSLRDDGLLSGQP
ncbi:interferon-induced very large GTPase 1 [Syngnathus typhle]|uniref:interferon-induced very large GTPase 1 n=1 Tax=Syngnathus typhle TaxID=161592 RepID=UPI002A6B5322|nr:interferon-induced very large GTPase 1 [Syngnathus typhle]